MKQMPRMPERFNYWLKIDLATLFNNLLYYTGKVDYIDISLPFFEQIWPNIEDGFLRSGLNGVISDNPRHLLNVSSAFTRILGHHCRSDESGYAMEGLIPVLSSFSECLSLSNMAQMHDQRLMFMLRMRSSCVEPCQNDDILAGICERISLLPMIDLCGFFNCYPQRLSEISALRSTLSTCEYSRVPVLAAAGSDVEEIQNLQQFIDWHVLALDSDSQGVFPCEIGFRAEPVKTGVDYQIFYVGIGRQNGLPESFPATVGGYPARVAGVFARHCELVIDGNCSGPFPVTGYLTGGPEHSFVALDSWKVSDLKNLLGHVRDCPIYLKTESEVMEIMPGFSG